MTSEPESPALRKTISLDFDGVVHAYSKGWHDGTIYDPPLPGVKDALDSLSLSYRLVISTCREGIAAIWDWLEVNELDKMISDVTNSKPIATVYLDDRAVRFEGDWPQALSEISVAMEGVAAISGPGYGRGGGG